MKIYVQATLLTAAAVFASPAFASTLNEELSLTANSTTAFFDVFADGTTQCTGCTGSFSSDGPDGTVSGIHISFQGYRVTVFGIGWGDLSQPDVQQLDVAATANQGPGTLTVDFLSNPPALGSALNVSESGLNSQAIQDSTTQFDVFTENGPIGEDIFSGYAYFNGFAGATYPNLAGGSQLHTSITMNFTGNGTMQAAFSVSNVLPEPGTMALAGGLLSLMGIAARRARR